MMMMGFGGMMNAGSMGMQNPYMMQQQMAMQQPPRVGESPFPPPVQGNPYEPQKKEKESLFKLPNVSMPNADWGEVAYNSSIALGAGAVAGGVYGVWENYDQAPKKGYEYDIKTGGNVTHKQEMVPRTEGSSLASQSHVKSVNGNLNASMEFGYRKSGWFNKGKGNEIESIQFKVDNNTTGKNINAVLQREGLRKQDFRLKLDGENLSVIYKQNQAGQFIPHKVIDDAGKTHHLTGWRPSVDYKQKNYFLSKMLGDLPEDAIKTKIPPNSVGRQLSGKAHFNPMGGRFGGLVTAGAALSALAVGGYTAWKTSQPKSSEEILKSLPPQGTLLPANDPRRIEQERNLNYQG